MPGHLLHENALVLCKHFGLATPTVTDKRVKVSGMSIVTQPPLYNIAGCILPVFGKDPCLTASWISISAASRVKASGQPVLLRDSQAICDPTKTDLTVVFTQFRVKGT
jgi:hypothetical protein